MGCEVSPGIPVWTVDRRIFLQRHCGTPEAALGPAACCARCGGLQMTQRCEITDQSVINLSRMPGVRFFPVASAAEARPAELARRIAPVHREGLCCHAPRWGGCRAGVSRGPCTCISTARALFRAVIEEVWCPCSNRWKPSWSLEGRSRALAQRRSCWTGGPMWVPTELEWHFRVGDHLRGPGFEVAAYHNRP